MVVSVLFSCSRLGWLVVQEGQLFVSSILVILESTQEEFLVPPWDWPKGQFGRRKKAAEQRPGLIARLGGPASSINRATNPITVLNRMGVKQSPLEPERP